MKEMFELGSANLFGVKLKAKLEVGPNYWDLE